jgi:hypothetical protein
MTPGRWPRGRFRQKEAGFGVSRHRITGREFVGEIASEGKKPEKTALSSRNFAKTTIFVG